MLANLSRREADLMIREQVPDLADIVARKLGRVAYAVYTAPDHLPVGRPSLGKLRMLPWVGFDEEHSYMPGQKWTATLLDGARPATRVNNWLVLLEAVRFGAGLAVMPCYLGDTDARLQRVGGILEDVSIEEWLLVHRDLRTLPRVRAAMDAVIDLFRRHKLLLGGGRDALVAA
jgi:DNA-binding transcriptional LysR family regulator